MSGTPVPVAAGQRYKGTYATDAHFTVPDPDSTVLNSVVSGTCFSNGDVTLLVIRGFTGSDHVFASAGADATFDIAMTMNQGADPWVFQSGDVIHARCATAAGDELTFGTTVP